MIETNHVIAIVITTFGVWLRNLALVFQPMRRKKQNQLPVHVVTRDFPRALCKLIIITRNSVWPKVLFFHVVTG